MAKTKEEALKALQANEYVANVAGQIERIEDSKTVIVGKLKEFTLVGAEENPSIDAAAQTLNGVVKVQGNKKTDPSAFMMEEKNLTLPDGYYKGLRVELGDVSEEYKLEAKTATPTKETQVIQEGKGFYGLSEVTINPIPAKYQDITGLTAENAHVLEGKSYYGANGKSTGTMPNNGSKSKVLDATDANQSFAIAEGYHDGTGAVSIVLEEKSPAWDWNSGNATVVTPTNGKVLSKVTINKPNATALTQDDAPVLAANEKNYTVTANVPAGYVAATDKKVLTLAKSTASHKGATVTVTAGYNANPITHSVDVTTVATPVLSGPTDEGVVTATQTQLAGYTAGDTTSDTLQLDMATAKATGKRVNVTKGWVPTNGIYADVKDGSVAKPVVADSTGVVSVEVTEGYVTSNPANLELGLAEQTVSGDTISVSTGWVPAAGLSEKVAAGSIKGDLNVAEGRVDITVPKNGYITSAANTHVDLGSIQPTVSGKTVNVPQGWHAAEQGYDVANGTLSENIFDSETGKATVTVGTGWIEGTTKSVTVPAANVMTQDANVITAPAGYRANAETFTMTNVGAITETINGLDCGAAGKVIVSKGAGYTAGGEVKLDNTIFNKLAAI